MNNSEDNTSMSVSKIFFFVISLFGLIPAIYHTVRGKQTVAEFVNNNRRFSLFQLSMTLFATITCLGSINLVMEKSYNFGLNYMLPFMAGCFGFQLLMILVLPRLDVFFIVSSFGEGIKNIAGKYSMYCISLIACLSAIFICVAQFQIGLSSAYFLHNDHKILGLWVIGMLIALYIARGGINAVVNSDIIQLFLGIGVVFLVLVIGFSLIKYNEQVATIKIIEQIKLDVHNLQFDISSLSLFLITLIPAFTPDYTSRIFLAKDKKQMQLAFVWMSIGWLILATFLYLTAKIFGIINPSENGVINIEYILKSFKLLDNFIKLIILFAYFMFAITTVDSLVQFTVIELANILNINKTEDNLIKFFKIMPFLLVIIICTLVQFNNNLATDFNWWYQWSIIFLLPTIAPIIVFYITFKRKFSSSIIPIIGVLVGIMATTFLELSVIFPNLNPGLIGALANLSILIIFKNIAKSESIPPNLGNTHE